MLFTPKTSPEDIELLVVKVKEHIAATMSPVNPASASDGRMFSLKDDDTNFDIRYSMPRGYNRACVTDILDKAPFAGDAKRVLGQLARSTNPSFVDKLSEYIRQKNLREKDVYKAALMDRRLFSQIISDRDYRPSKDSCISLCYALKLTLEETNDMLSRAGYALSHSSKRDVILEYFFLKRYYNVEDINDVLFKLEQKTLTRY